jgi:hypothetical protein
MAAKSMAVATGMGRPSWEGEYYAAMDAFASMAAVV